MLTFETVYRWEANHVERIHSEERSVVKHDMTSPAMGILFKRDTCRRT